MLKQNSFEYFYGLPIKVFKQIAEKPSLMTECHWHDWYEVLYIVDGSIQISLNNQTLNFKKDDIVLINPFDTHEIHSIVPNTSMIVLLFSSELLSNVSLNREGLQYFDQFIDNAIFSSGYFSTPSEYHEQILDILNQMNNIYLNNESSSELILLGLLFIFVGYIKKSKESCKGARSSSEPGKISKICKYIEENYSHPLMVRDVAKALGYSAAYISRLFFEFTGQNIKHYIDFVKINEAEKIIKFQSKSISEIAGMAGFNNVNSFSRTFKRMKGYSPSMYK